MLHAVSLNADGKKGGNFTEPSSSAWNFVILNKNHIILVLYTQVRIVIFFKKLSRIRDPRLTHLSVPAASRLEFWNFDDVVD